MNYEDKVKIAKKVIGWALYNDIQVKDALIQLNDKRTFSQEELDWAYTHLERMAHMDCLMKNFIILGRTDGQRRIIQGTR